jgi:hypothetical protein
MRDAIDVLGLLTGWAAGYFLVNRNPWPWGLHPNHPGPLDLIADEGCMQSAPRGGMVWVFPLLS